MAARMPMTMMTMSSSIRVKPWCAAVLRDFIAFPVHPERVGVAHIDSRQVGRKQTGMNVWVRAPRKPGHVRPRSCRGMEVHSIHDHDGYIGRAHHLPLEVDGARRGARPVSYTH